MPTEYINTLIKDWKLWPNICTEQPNQDEFKALINGLTNNNLLFSPQKSVLNSENYFVFRINAPNAQALGLNRQAEWHIHQCVAQYNLCKPYIYRDPKDVYWVRPFIDSQTLSETLDTCSEQATRNYFKEVAKKLRTIHSIPISSSWPMIDFKQRTDHFWQQILKHSLSSTDLRNLLSNYKTKLDCQLKSTGYALRLCHMDPNPSNWIIDNNNTYLIDWEYAAIGNPAWDLAVFCDNCNLTDTQKQQFLKDYGSGQVNGAQFQLADRQMKYLSALWYCVQKLTTPESLPIELDKLTN